MTEQLDRVEPTLGTPDPEMDWGEPETFTPSAPDRPLLVTLIAVLFVLGGIGTIFVNLGNWSLLDRAGQSISFEGSLPLAWLLTSVAYVVCGLLLFFGNAIGWYLLTYLCIATIFASGNVIMILQETGIEPTLMTGKTISWYTKAGLRILTHLLLQLYLFRQIVLNYFGVRRPMALLALTAFVVFKLGTSFVEF